MNTTGLSDEEIFEVLESHELDCRCRLCLAFVHAASGQLGIQAARGILEMEQVN